MSPSSFAVHHDAALVFRTVLKGTAEVTWADRRVRLDPDAWLVLDGLDAGVVRVDGPADGELLTVAVSTADRDAAFDSLPAAMEALMPQGGGARSPGNVRFADHLRPLDGPVGRRLHAIALARAAGGTGDAERREHAALVRDALVEEVAMRQRAARLSSVKRATRDALLRRILLATDHIGSHHDEPLTIEEMAAVASLSPSHFTRLFTIVHGETPHAYLVRKRIAAARRHLAVGSRVVEAAARAGFGSRSTLFRNLRKAPTVVVDHPPCSRSA